MPLPNRYFDAERGVWVTKCPPGEALGANDLTTWSLRRSCGWSGSDGRKERQAVAEFKRHRKRKKRRYR